MSSIIKKEIRDLQSIDYVLCEYDIYCGRGNQCFHHIGNQKFRKIVLDNLNRYSDAKRKYDKSSIIDEIVDQVRENCRPYNGLGFVRKDSKTGRFYEVGNFIAREKTSQAFRDALLEKSHPIKAILINEKEHKNSSMVYKSNEENDECHSDISSMNSNSFNSFEDASNQRKNSPPSTKSYNSIFDIFAVQSEAPQQKYLNYYMKNPWNAEKSSLIYPIPVTSSAHDESNIDVVLSNETIQTTYSRTNFNDSNYSYYNDTAKPLSSCKLNDTECYFDSNHQSSVVRSSSSSSQINKQAQFAMSRIEAPISDDENTFDLLLQFTESHPELGQCPFL